MESNSVACHNIAVLSEPSLSCLVSIDPSSEKTRADLVFLFSFDQQCFAALEELLGNWNQLVFICREVAIEFCVAKLLMVMFLAEYRIISCPRKETKEIRSSSSHAHVILVKWC